MDGDIVGRGAPGAVEQRQALFQAGVIDLAGQECTAHAHDFDVPTAQRRQRIGVGGIDRQRGIKLFLGLGGAVAPACAHHTLNARLIAQ
jgi:hypothetical protein